MVPSTFQLRIVETVSKSGSEMSPSQVSKALDRTFGLGQDRLHNGVSILNLNRGPF